jgi:two-component system, LytTR family, response regulator
MSNTVSYEPPERKIKVIVVDDEPLARAKLKDMLKRHTDFQLIGECKNGLEAVEAISSQEPDLVFLDIEMPHLSGVEVVRTIGIDRMPLTVFVTAFGDFAVEAFEVQALDYLLKPFDDERFNRALLRVRESLAGVSRSDYEGELREFLTRMNQRTPYTQRFLVKRLSEYLFIRASEIDWVQSADNYVTLHVGKQKYMLRETLSSIEERLDPQQFLRIRASAIVNLERVAAIRPWSSTEFQFVLQDGTTIVSSRRYRNHLREVIP